MTQEAENLEARRAKLPRHQFYVIITRMSVPAADAIAALKPRLTAHLDWLNDLEARGVLFAAGPVRGPEEANWDGTGMFVVRAASLDEARALAEAEPFHAAGLRTFELFPWQVNEGGFQLQVRFSGSEASFR